MEAARIAIATADGVSVCDRRAHGRGKVGRARSGGHAGARDGGLRQCGHGLRNGSPRRTNASVCAATEIRIREGKMCRSIKVLRRAGETVTGEELNAAALQFVRKISGFHKPSKANP